MYRCILGIGDIVIVLDDTKKKILQVLSEDGRKTLTEIATKLNITHVAVKKQLMKLMESGIVKIQPLINPSALNLLLVATLIEAEDLEAIQRLKEKFKNCPRMILLASLIGGYNMLALLIAEDMNVVESMNNVCSIRTSKGIRRSEVFMVSELIIPKYVSLRLIPSSERKSEITPCGLNCCICSRFNEYKCLGCPATKCYRGPL